MTLSEVRSQIVAILCRQDTLAPTDFSAIQIADVKLSPHRDTLILAAVEDLVHAGILRPAAKDPVTGEGRLWILASPMQFADQTVTISMPVAIDIADTINTFLDAHDFKDDRVDPMGISEQHIVTVLQILSDILGDSDLDDEGGDDQQFAGGSS